MGAVKRGVCVHGVVAGGLCDEWKWEQQSGEVHACMVLSLGCVKSGSGSSQAYVGMVFSLGCVTSGSGSCQAWCWRS